MASGRARFRTRSEGVSRRDFMIRAGMAGGGVVLGGGLTGAARSEGPPRRPPMSPAPIAYTEAEPLRVALIGTGGRMTFGLLPAILAEPHVKVVACADVTPFHLNRALDRVERATGLRPEGFVGERDFPRVIARPDVHAIFSACPCDLHAEIQVEALLARKPIYAEKPAAITIEETRRLRDAWFETSSLIQLGFQRRLNPRYQEGIAMIREGALGRPVEARAAWNNSGGPGESGSWLQTRARSGDMMIEQACHTWDVLSWVTGELPSRAFGVGRRDLFRDVSPERDVTDHYIAALEFPSGFTANFTHSLIAPQKDNGAFSGVYERVAGLAGGIDLGAGRVTFVDRTRAPRLIHPAQPRMTEDAVRHFFRCVREGRHPDSSLDQGIDATLVGLLVRRAVDEGRPVTMDELLSA